MEEFRRPLIMITNDDSINAPGLHSLVECVRGMGDITVVAPAEPRSGQSSALSVGTMLKIKELESNDSSVRLLSVNGTPADCVKLGLHAIVRRKPDILLSGINHGSNSGTCITYSGTMGAVLEGCMQHIPSVGFSLLDHSAKADFSLAMNYVADITRKVLSGGLPDNICLNVNIPSKVIPEGIRVCRAARGFWTEEYKKYTDPAGTPFYLLTGHFVNEEPEARDTDEYWLSRNYVSVVPVDPNMSAPSAAGSIAELLNCEQMCFAH